MKRELPKDCKVFFTHVRHFNGEVWAELSPRGGVTEARIVRGGEVIGTGYAFCSRHDNFNKRIGRDIAQGRALKDLEKSEVRTVRTPQESN